MTAGLPPPIALTSEGLSVIPGAWPFLRSRREVLAAAPFISVIICTRNQRPKQLVSCLRHVNEQKYPRFEIIVVENAPEASHIRLKVDNSQDSVVCRYIEEPRAGLSWARNAGIEAASGEIVAFLDDDEEPDNYWLAELARGFSRGDDIGCVSGMILPAGWILKPRYVSSKLVGTAKAVVSRQLSFRHMGRRVLSILDPHLALAATWLFGVRH